MSTPIYDWEAIKVDYEAGVLSMREVGRRHDVPESTLRRKAKKDDWRRQVSQKVRDRARENMLRSDAQTAQLRTPNAQSAPERDNKPLSDDDVLEYGASQIEGVVRLHRKDIADGRTLVELMLAELKSEVVNKDLLGEMVDQYIDAEDMQLQTANIVRKAVSLPTRAKTLSDLSHSMQRLVALERQAHNIDDDGNDEAGSLAEALNKARKRAQQE